MDAVRRILARSLFRWSASVVIAGVIIAIAVPLGCRNQQPPTNTMLSGPPIVRVRLVQDASTVKLSATAEAKQIVVRTAGGDERRLAFPVGQPIAVGLADGGWRVGSVLLAAGDLSIEADPPGSLTVEGRPYRGSYRLVTTKSGAAFDLVNHLTVDDYLRGVLSAELYPEFQIEAYKAQAIVARTYALYVARTGPADRHWDLHADVRSQMYGGIRTETAKSIEAAEATKGLVVAYGPKGQERIFKAYYSSCCGGATQTAQDAFGDPAFEPFTDRSVGRRCDISAGKYHAKFDWGPVVVSKDELARRFKLWGRNQGHALKNLQGVRRVDVYKATAAGRPTWFSIEDGKGTRYVLSSEQLRLAVNTDAADASRLASGFVTPVSDGTGNAIRFQNGHGFGHGVGMCQWCIEAEARQGAKSEQIVLDAYKGAVIVKAY